MKKMTTNNNSQKLRLTAAVISIIAWGFTMNWHNITLLIKSSESLQLEVGVYFKIYGGPK